MQLPGSLVDVIALRLSERLGHPVDVEQAVPIGGGSINDAYRLETSSGRFFVKTNSADRFPSLFEAEADGMERLRATHTVRVPEVLAFGEDQDTTFLLLPFLQAAPRAPNYFGDLGRALARLHACTAERFGLERDNYIGPLPQINTWHATWVDFFLHCRLEPLVKQARDRQRLEAGDALRFERLFGKLDRLFPAERPALLHGDLWKGNAITGPDGAAWLVDPAVYYGHREMDLAMTRLFGGFDGTFHAAYNEAAPLEHGWEERVDLCNLYPLLVHVLLFGGGYLTQMRTVLGRFV
ncbi:MAG: fructosamine kinase family protein [Flavobacteriales bacterium]